MAKKNKVSKGEQTKAIVQVKPKSEIVQKHGIVYKTDEQIKEVKVKEEVNIPNVYHPNYKLIDDTIEDIKKVSRKVCSGDYASNNVYVFLQDCLKRITLAEK